MNSNIKTGIFWVILACVLVLLWQVVRAAKTRPDKAISFTEFVADVDRVLHHKEEELLAV